MSYLVDTNVISELRRKTPDESVVAWFTVRPVSTLYLSVLSLGEVRRGIEVLADGNRKLQLIDWLEVGLPTYFSGRILEVSAAVADRWGRLVANARRPLPAIDSLLAATAIEHDLALVTRNTRDFAGLPVNVIDPWLDE